MEVASEPYSSPGPLSRPETITKSGAIPSKSLYISHFLSTWNTRGFEFGAVLFLATIYPGTLLPMSVYALIRAAVAILLSPKVGHYIDTQERLSVVRLSIVGQRIAVVLSCLGFLFILQEVSGRSAVLDKVVFGLLIMLACIEKLCSIMNTVAIERDWVVVIADEQEGVLQELNSQMRRIDLFCKLVAPLAIALLDGRSTKIALLVTLAFNVFSVTVEYAFIARVYQRTPALARQVFTLDPVSEDGLSLREIASAAENSRAKQHTVFSALATYVKSAAFLPSFALAMLYLTVLSFAGQMVTFLLALPNPRWTSTSIGLIRTASTVFEISSTFVAPRVMTAVGPVRAGMWCLSWQLLCLTPGVAVLWSPETSMSASGIILFIVTVILSRIGLWSFDLVAQLLIQDSVGSSERGTFSSAEASLQNFFELCTFAMTTVFSKPEQFKFPALVSLIATYCAAGLYAKYVRDRRGHLLHVSSCFKSVERGGGADRYEPVDTQEDLEMT